MDCPTIAPLKTALLAAMAFLSIFLSSTACDNCGEVTPIDDVGGHDATVSDAGDDTDNGDAIDLGGDTHGTADTGDATDGDASEDTDTGDDPDDLFTTGCVPVSENIAIIEYEIAASSDSYMIVPYVEDEEETFDPLSITTPTGAFIDLHGDNSFQLYGLEYPETQWLNPMVFPPAPNFDDQFETGIHTLELSSEASRVCYYLIEDRAPSTTLDLNIYLVGLDELDLSSGTADSHGDFQEVLSSVDTIFGQADLSIDNVRYFDLPQDAVEAYRVIHDYYDLYELIAHSQSPGDGRDDKLSLNIFVVERFTDGTVGLAMGIPGAAGLHESHVSGLGISGEYIGIDGDHNLFTGVVMAHEIGHFLGLFHTSETDGVHFDNLDDTPECDNINQSWNCPDAQNLMFPWADFDTTELTQDQGYVLSVNPLTR